MIDDIETPMGEVFIGDNGFKDEIGIVTETVDEIQFKLCTYFLNSNGWNNLPFIDY